MAVNTAVLNTYTAVVSVLLFAGVLLGHRIDGTLKGIVAGFVLVLVAVFLLQEVLIVVAAELSKGIPVQTVVEGVLSG